MWVIKVFQMGEVVYVKKRGCLAIILDPKEQIMAVEQNSLEPYANGDVVSLADPRFSAIASFARNGVLNHNIRDLSTAFDILRSVNR
ncbi:MAG: hypothetical protein ACM3ZQ_11105 [Bacillota bacterium]